MIIGWAPWSDAAGNNLTHTSRLRAAAALRRHSGRPGSAGFTAELPCAS